MAPQWGNYLYSNLLPLQNDWLAGLTSAAAVNSTTPDMFSFSLNSLGGQAGPSTYGGMDVYGGSIAPALLAPSGSPILAEQAKTDVPSPLPSPTRQHSIDSDAEGEVDHDLHHDDDTRSHNSVSGCHSEHEHHDHDEGVERDGMIWGMKVDDYRSLSARERKRVRNRISARTFRAKRKEHLSSLESTLGAKDLDLRLAHEENARLRREVGDLKRRLAKYEQGPY